MNSTGVYRSDGHDLTNCAPNGNSNRMMHNMQNYTNGYARSEVPVHFHQVQPHGILNTHVTRNPSLSVHFQHHDHALNQVSSVHPVQNASRHSNVRDPCADGNMLDLVAGFDKHAAAAAAASAASKEDITEVLESRPSTWPANSHLFAGTIGESPYITSQSFDDMHKCLGGIDMPSHPSHLDLNEATTQAKHDKQLTLSAESPYITTKSFDDMHKFGMGLSTSAMSHIDLGAAAVGSKYQDNDSTQSSLAFESNQGVENDVIVNGNVADPRSDKLLSAFSPFDGARLMQDEAPACKFDLMIRRVVAPVGAQPVAGISQTNQRHGIIVAPQARHFVETRSAPNYANNQFNPYGLQAHYATSQRPNASMTYEAQNAAAFDSGLDKFFNNQDGASYHQTVSTSGSERSSDGVNSSPDQDCTDLQSD
jgi:hypothetical protein